MSYKDIKKLLFEYNNTSEKKKFRSYGTQILTKNHIYQHFDPLGL